MIYRIWRLLLTFLLLGSFLCVSISAGAASGDIVNEDVNCLQLDPVQATEAEKALCRNSRVVSFTPVPGDVSVVFLGNIFGSVDGVLAGSGSQIIGEMYGVFNAGLLAFGGIVILYTLMVSTLNTAAEGQLMGQKWSSVWIPIRSTFGLAFLMPQASGYCMMQIFVMWIVLQGIGAADSIWAATLSYLNRGGVLVQKQIDPGKSADAGDGAIMTAAMGVAAAQVCMKTLNIAYESYKANVAPSTTCIGGTDPSNYIRSNYPDGLDNPWFIFCNTPVPDFVSSVNIASNDNLATAEGTVLAQLMPYFGLKSAENIYSSLNGICGELKWNVYQAQKSDSELSRSEEVTIKNSRTIAVHQLYTALLTISMPIVSNAPYFNSTIDCYAEGAVCMNVDYAQHYYGYPLTRNYATGCKNRLTSGQDYTSTMACTDWGTIYQQATIFNGKELQDAVAAYNGIMLPTLALQKLNESSNSETYKNKRKFINEANNQGWLMAGAYFFKVALLNNYVSQATGGNHSPTDDDSGLKFTAGAITGNEGALWKYGYIQTALISPANNNSPCKDNDSFSANKISPPFCHLSDEKLQKIGGLIVGTSPSAGNDPLPTYESMYSTGSSSDSGYLSFNVVNYLKNSNSMLLPDQKIILDAGLYNGSTFDFNAEQSVVNLGKSSFSGGKWGQAGSITSFVWNGILRPLWNTMLSLMMPPVMEFASMMITPMLGMSAQIFDNALEVMRMDGVNPVIAIAVMGTQYIDGVGDAWLAMTLYVAAAAFFPPGFAVLMMLMPVVTGWMGVMLTIGFSAAYYVPFIPVLIFTFAGIGWLIGVIEAMTAAPIVALGAIHPEGSEAFGKADAGLMILLNMFLRPSLMITGYVFGIVLSYVGVWVMNAGFNMTQIDQSQLRPLDGGAGFTSTKSDTMYGFWSNIMLFYFSILSYSTLYISIVQQSFELIYYLPDRILRWLSGGLVEELGESTTKSMLADVKNRMDEAGSAASGVMAKVSGSLQAVALPRAGDGGDKMGLGSGSSDAMGGSAGGASAKGGGGGSNTPSPSNG